MSRMPEGGPMRLGPIGQIAMPVRDIGRATTFYSDALQMPLLF